MPTSDSSPANPRRGDAGRFEFRIAIAGLLLLIGAWWIARCQVESFEVVRAKDPPALQAVEARPAAVVHRDPVLSVSR